MLTRFFIIFFIAAFEFAQIRAENTPLSSIKKVFDQAAPQTLVVLDIDGVLLMPTDEILRLENKSILYQYLEDLSRSHFHQSKDLWNLVEKKTRLKLRDPQWKQMIKSLQDRKIKVTGFFMRKTRRIDPLVRAETTGFVDTKPLGADFSQSFEEIGPLFSGFGEEVYMRTLKSQPTFHDGIIDAKDGRVSQAQLLGNFLNEVAGRNSGIPWFHHYPVKSFYDGKPILKVNRHKTGWDYRTVLRKGIEGFPESEFPRSLSCGFQWVWYLVSNVLNCER